MFQIWGHGHCCRKKWTWVGPSSCVWEEKDTPKNRDLICWSLLRGMSRKKYMLWKIWNTGFKECGEHCAFEQCKQGLELIDVLRKQAKWCYLEISGVCLLPALDFCVTDQLTWLIITDLVTENPKKWIGLGFPQISGSFRLLKYLLIMYTLLYCIHIKNIEFILNIILR